MFLQLRPGRPTNAYSGGTEEGMTVFLSPRIFPLRVRSVKVEAVEVSQRWRSHFLDGVP